MNRRDFIKFTACASLGSILLGCGNQEIQTQTGQGTEAIKDGVPPALTDLIVVQGNDPVAMLSKGFDALGGINTFIKQGNTVVLKPNFSVPRLPEEACTTNPLLVSSLIKMCLQAGAKEVKVIDYPFTNPIICLEKTGMKKAVTDAGGKIYT